MILDDAESELLKVYITKLLEDVSDADSDVLADYVLALIKTDDAVEVAKPNCVENLRDFLGDRAESFVQQVFDAIATKAYDPTVKQTPAAHSQAALGPAGSYGDSRKRAFDETEEPYAGRGPPLHGGDRPVKQPRRGGRGGGGGQFDQRGGRQQYGGAPFQHPNVPMPQMPGMPPFNFDPSTLDPNDPVAGLFALQQAMGSMMPGGMPGFPMPGAPPPTNGNRNSRRCRDYDTKGFCARGASCNFEHGDDPYIVGNEEYDPTQATLLNVQPSRTGFVNTSSNARGRGGQRGRGNPGFRGGGKRSEYAHAGPNHDTSITSVVVEQIPEDKFDEQSVRDFFGEFGNIEEVNMQPYKRLAVVKYEDYDSAKAAYDSPKVIFDNRFVKVYWYKANALQKPPHGRAPAPYRKATDGQEEEPRVDPEELARKQAEAQRRHEEQKKMVEDARKQKEEIEARVKKIEAERKEMNAMLAKKAGKPVPSEEPVKANEGAEVSEQQKNLRETLAKLEAEAKSLGIDPNAPANTSYPSRGRGGYRGWGRGRGLSAPYRGGWPARGGRGGNVLRLDNRPKAITVSFKDGGYEDHDEALRQWLLFNAGESTTLNKHPSKQNAALVEFDQRFQAENFMAAASAPAFPLAGKIEEISWQKPATTGENDQADVTMAGTKEEEAPARYDVDDRDDDRDDEDRWG